MPRDQQDPIRAPDCEVSVLPSPEDLEQTIAWLAGLSTLEYERVREKEAKRLSLRVSVLDREVAKARPRSEIDTGAGQPLTLPEPEPWTEPVDGEALLDDLVAALRRYLALVDGAAEAMALWIVHTYLYFVAQISPRLALCSPEKRCGKTTTLMVLDRLVRQPLAAANITAAAIFRTIEVAQPTLLLDEADTFLTGKDDLRGILNSGHNQASAYVIRTVPVGDGFEPRRFSTWSPCAIAMIGKLPGTLEDRSVVIPMRRRRPDEKVARFRLDRTDDLDRLARRVARWAEDNQQRIASADPEVPHRLHDRAADNWRVLFAIADAAGGNWPERARRTALILSGGQESASDSVRTRLLRDIQDLFVAQAVDRLPSAEICEALTAMDDRPWPEWRNGKPITPTQLAALLSPFGIVPGTIRIGTGTPKGYRLEQFRDAFARYLGAAEQQSATAPHSSNSAISGTCRAATEETDVAAEDRRERAGSAICGGVAAEPPSVGADGWEAFL